MLDKLTQHPKKIFLIDGIGGLVTATLLYALLARFEPFFGMPRSVLYWLSGIACLYALYSITCYFLLKDNWKPYLRVIALANLGYCCLTFGLLFYHAQSLSIWGFAYFLGEIAIILALARIEWRLA